MHTRVHMLAPIHLCVHVCYVSICAVLCKHVCSVCYANVCVFMHPCVHVCARVWVCVGRVRVC